MSVSVFIYCGWYSLKCLLKCILFSIEYVGCGVLVGYFVVGIGVIFWIVRLYCGDICFVLVKIVLVNLCYVVVLCVVIW